MTSGVTNLTMHNNIIYQSGDADYEEDVVNANKVIGENIIYNSTVPAGRFICCKNTRVTRTLAQHQTFQPGKWTGSILSNPLFVNPTIVLATQNYRLQAGSPGIDFGTVIAGINQRF